MNASRIIGVAVRFREKIYSLPRPQRHCDVFRHIAAATGADRVNGDMHLDQGFVDESGEFLNRYEALERAKQTGQLVHQHVNKILCSEDIW